MPQPAQHQVRWRRVAVSTQPAPGEVVEGSMGTQQLLRADKGGNRTAGSFPPGCFFYRSLFKPDQTRHLPQPQSQARCLPAGDLNICPGALAGS